MSMGNLPSARFHQIEWCEHSREFSFDSIMNANKFRALALSLPEATESEHMGHPDFRVRGKIFATLFPDDDWGVVKLLPSQQESFVREEPHIFQPVPGAWGRRGYTRVQLGAAHEATVRRAMVAAWQ